jgi:hypothetical protein
MIRPKVISNRKKLDTVEKAIKEFDRVVGLKQHLAVFLFDPNGDIIKQYSHHDFDIMLNKKRTIRKAFTYNNSKGKTKGAF